MRSHVLRASTSEISVRFIQEVNNFSFPSILIDYTFFVLHYNCRCHTVAVVVAVFSRAIINSW